jgi:hypothetical protein
MFEIVLAISVIVVLAAIALYRVDAGVIVFLFGLGIVLSIPFLSFSARWLFLIYPALFITWAVCRRAAASRRAFAGYATLAVVSAWGVAMALFIPRWREVQALAAAYPVVRVDERLAYERDGGRRPKDVSQSSVVPSDEMLNEAADRSRWRDRRGASLVSLGRVHDSFVDAFTQQEELGLGRMQHIPVRDEYIRLPDPEPIPLAAVMPDSSSAGELEVAEPISVADAGPFREFHHDQVLEFVNPKGFGYALDGEWSAYGRIGATRIRGFQPHAFREPPGPQPAGEDWQLTKLELVSLLKHDPPAVYLSDHLPRMQDLSSDDAPTRLLDGFESASLERLLEGATVIADESRNEIRMLGGLRAAQQCTQCHSVREGHLLGAFSYEFRRKVPVPANEEKPEEAAKPVI